MCKEKAEMIAYAIRREWSKYSLLEWLETWDITMEEFEEFLKNAICNSKGR